MFNRSARARNAPDHQFRNKDHGWFPWFLPRVLLASRALSRRRVVKIQSRMKPVRKENQVIGRINFYNHAKGYGFITVTVPPQSPTEAPSQEQYFFHHSNFRDGATPAIGAYVSFGLAPGIAEGKKPQAVGIRFATHHEVNLIDAGVAALAGGSAQ
jgi:cold shock CspA family protein